MESLSEYIARRKPDKVVELRKAPAWIRRAQEQGHQTKDFTDGSFRPVGSDGAA